MRVEALRKEGLVVRRAPDLGAADHVAVDGLKGAGAAVTDRLRDQITRAWEPGSQRLVIDKGN
jgi:hypothetical protein